MKALSRKSIRVLTYIIYPLMTGAVSSGRAIDDLFVYGEMDRYGSVCLGRMY